MRQPIHTVLDELGRTREAVCDWLMAAGWVPNSLGDASLVVSELVANAVVHGKPPAELEVRLLEEALRVEVRDAEPSGPVLSDQPSEAGGYGLRIVDSIASRWGWEPVPGGKVVWAELSRPSGA